MALNPINVNVETPSKSKASRNTSFGSAGNPIISVMDAVDRGGYIASFFAQDFCGFIAPRVTTGLNRNREETGQYNWKFASTEAIREVLSGPSMIAIPAAMLWATKRRFGTAHDVRIDHISALGQNFKNFASNQAPEKLLNKDIMRKEFYADTVRNVLHNSTNGELKGKDLDEKVKYYADKLLAAESAPKKPGWKSFINKPVEGSSQDMLSDLANEFTDLRKQHCGSGVNPLNVEYGYIGKDGKEAKLPSSFKKFFSQVKDYSDDAINTVASKFKSGSGSVGEFVKTFNHKRAGSRFALTLGMDLAVAAFLCVVPKLYKHKDGNPGLAGLVDDPAAVDGADNTEKPAGQPSFGSLQGMGEKLVAGKGGRKFADAIEYSGMSMSSASLLGLFYLGVVTPRYVQAYDKYDRREILRRDLISLTALTFLAQALNKGFSQVFTKTTGLVLNHKPEGFNKLGKKVWNYIYPEAEFNTLKSPDILAKYTNIDKFKNGIADFCEFIKEKGGDVNKVLSMDKDVKLNTEKILGKSIKDAKYDEIISSFNKAKGSVELGNIYKVFSNVNNKYVKKAKTLNNTFNFISTFLLTPALIVWIAKSNEKMTKKRILQEQSAKTEARKISRQYFAANNVEKK